MEKYNEYTVDDFLDDDDLIRHVKSPDADDLRRWDEWLSGAPPASAAAFRDAVACLSAMLSVTRILPGPQTLRESWEQVEGRLARLDRRRGIVLRIRVAAAAAIAALVFATAAFWYFTVKVSVSTDYAQQREVELPDHSIVVLNAHSTLSWYRGWSWRSGRDVWLNGEALFKVGHSDSADVVARPFTAYAGSLTVRVLGTTFNIRQRRDEIQVALMNGKISVSRNDHAREAMILQPGELVSYKDRASAINRVRTPVSQPQAWVNHTIQASGMTVQDIIDHYEDTYGNKIVLGDTSQASKKIDGSLSLETEDGVVYMLANILNANIHRDGRMIYLRPK